MKQLVIVIIIAFPLFTNAQKFTPPKPKIGDPFLTRNQHPQLPQLETVKPISLDDKDKAKAKLAREEHKLIKLAKKRWEEEADLKEKQEKLKSFEITSKNINNYNHQKKIDDYKKQIASSQNNLDQAKIKEESSSKKVKDLERAVEEAIFKKRKD